MKSGLPGLECQAHGSIASESWIRGGNAVKKLRYPKNQDEVAYFL
jgi:hypothetical protein